MTGNEAPKISYIVPCYNARNYLYQCLESIGSLTRDSYEIIVVDDGSTEPVQDIVEAFAPHARYVNQANQGAAAARNTGIAASGGAYLRFLDADDYLLTAESLSEQVQMLDDNPRLGLVYGQSVKIDSAGRPIGERSSESAGKTYIRSGAEELFDLLPWNYITMSTVIARRSAIVRAGMFRTDLRSSDGRSRTNEDHECWINVARVADIGYLHAPIAAYRVHAGGVSVRKSLAQLEKEMEAIDRFFSDEEFARRYAVVRPEISHRRTQKLAAVAYRNGRLDVVRRHAPVAVAQSLKRRNWRQAAGWAHLLTTAMVPQPRRQQTSVARPRVGNGPSS